MRDLKAIASTDQVQRYLGSQMRQRTIEEFTAIKNGACVKKSFAFLAIELSLDNINRSGEVKNLRDREFQSATVSSKDQSAKIWVKEHKGRNNHGPARLYLKGIGYLRVPFFYY